MESGKNDQLNLYEMNQSDNKKENNIDYQENGEQILQEYYE